MIAISSAQICNEHVNVVQRRTAAGFLSILAGFLGFETAVVQSILGVFSFCKLLHDCSDVSFTCSSA